MNFCRLPLAENTKKCFAAHNAMFVWGVGIRGVMCYFTNYNSYHRALFSHIIFSSILYFTEFQYWTIIVDKVKRFLAQEDQTQEKK